MLFQSRLRLHDHQRPLSAALHCYHMNRCLSWSTFNNSWNCWKPFKQIRPYRLLKKPANRRHQKTSRQSRSEPRSLSLKRSMRCEYCSLFTWSLRFADIYLLVAGTQRLTNTRSRSHWNRRMKWPTWINIYLLFASELISTWMSLHISPPNKDGLDKKTADPTYYVDIKSEGLRNTLRTMLRDIRAVNLNEDKPAV